VRFSDLTLNEGERMKGKNERKGERETEECAVYEERERERERE